MILFRRILFLAVSTILALGSSSCLTQRTVSQNGHVVSQDYVVDRPIRDAIRESRD
jgi:hypothetical protein